MRKVETLQRSHLMASNVFRMVGHMSIAAVVIVAVGLTSTASVHATSIVNPGSYVLSDHPDGAVTATLGPYGIRLDHFDGNNNAGPTFSVEGGTPMILTWGGTINVPSATATITGQALNNTTNELWNVAYTLTGVSGVLLGVGPDFMGFTATGGMGTLSRLGEPDFNFAGVAKIGDQDGIVFQFLGDGHRLGAGSMGIVGRGWVLDNADNCCDDFLVTATAVPEPGTMILFGSGLLGLAAWRRFKKTV